MAEERLWCVYKHTNKINGKVYIGQTCKEPTRRWESRSGYKSCTHFNRAIEKYGWDNFEHEVLYAELALEEADEIERKLIKEYKSNDPNFGYNIKEGGHNSKLPEITKERISKAKKGSHASEETKKKLSDMRQKENHPMWGRHHTEESKKKMSEARKGANHPNWGKHHSPETIAKMKQSHHNVKGKNNPNWGRKYSEERKKKISKPVRCVETGVVYYGAKKAADELDIDASQVSKCCKGKRKTAGGYHWEYYIEEDNT